MFNQNQLKNVNQTLRNEIEQLEEERIVLKAKIRLNALNVMLFIKNRNLKIFFVTKFFLKMRLSIHRPIHQR